MTLPKFFQVPKVVEPLRVLFCGSDHFSVASLQSLHNLHQNQKDLIASIDVVCRPGKPVGRGRKKIRNGKLSPEAGS